MIDLREKFEEKLKSGHHYVLNVCSMCGYDCNYFSREGNLYYDSGCDCMRGPPSIRMCDWSDLDFYFKPEHGHLKNFEEWVGQK
jgi:hypothetical protein